VTPYNTLRHTGGAAGVENVEIVIKAGFEVPFGRFTGQCVLIGQDSVSWVELFAAIFDHDQVVEAR